MLDCPSPIHPNNLNLSFNYFFLRLSSAKMQLKTFLLFSRDSFLFLLLLPPHTLFFPFLIALSSSASGPLVSKCEQMENKSNCGSVWSGQRLAACYFLVRTTTAGWWSGPWFVAPFTSSVLVWPKPVSGYSSQIKEVWKHPWFPFGMIAILVGPSSVQFCQQSYGTWEGSLVRSHPAELHCIISL